MRSSSRRDSVEQKLLETNKMMLLQYATRKSVEENPVDWDNLKAEEEGEEEEELMDVPCNNCGALRCQKDRKFFIDLPKDFITKTVILCGARRDFLEKFRVTLDATITFQCTIMNMLMAQQLNCLVTNEPTRTYFGCPGWTAIAAAYEMEDGERATFYLDYDRDEIMV
ncbi:hypothetical protein D1007_22886 [Hordeum vulgare]|nr:hypothetical protein D1007_22886 [Hordeum vulgare]